MQRLASEITRLGDASVLAGALGRNRNTIYDWKKKGNIPGYELARLAELGADVVFIFTGQHSLERISDSDPDLLGEHNMEFVVSEIVEMIQEEAERHGVEFDAQFCAVEAVRVFLQVKKVGLSRVDYQEVAKAIVHGMIRMWTSVESGEIREPTQGEKS